MNARRIWDKKQILSGPLPLYFQIGQIIRSKILTGEFSPGEQIPTEKELSEVFQVSSITTRQAILNLVEEGLLVRRQGKGTFVSKKIRGDTPLQLKGSINDLITEALKTHEVKVLDIIKLKTPERVAKLLNIGERDEVIKVRRTTTLNRVPTSYIINYLPLDIGEKIRKEDLRKSPMLQILMDKIKIPLQGGIQYIEAIAADYEISSALSVSILSPILYVETIIFATKKRPVDFVQTFSRTDLHKLSVKLSVKKGPGKGIRIAIRG